MYNYNEIKDIHLEVTSKCQAKCPMCPRRLQGGPMNPWVTLEEITLAIFKEWFPVEFLQQLHNLNMCGNLGDPIIARDTALIFEYLRYVNPDMSLQMHTNGSARNKEFWQSIAASRVTVVFGIDGLADTHYKYRVNTNWHRIIENAKLFIQTGGDARWDMLIFEHNQHQVDECKKLANDLGFSKFVSKNSSRFKDGKYDVLDNAGVPVDVLYPTSLSKEYTVKSQAAQEDRSPVITCKAQAQKQIYVAASGNVSLCCWLDLEWLPPVSISRIDYMKKIRIFPNLHNLTLKEIFESGYFGKVEETWTNGACLKECAKQCGSFDKLGAQFES